MRHTVTIELNGLPNDTLMDGSALRRYILDALEDADMSGLVTAYRTGVHAGSVSFIVPGVFDNTDAALGLITLAEER